MVKYLVSFLAMILVIMVFFLNRLSNFDLLGYAQHCIISFKYQQNILEGTLILPLNKVSPPFVLLIHGDGSQDRWSKSGYIPLVKFLVSKGIAVFSWDKPGVGKSTGNWAGTDYVRSCRGSRIGTTKAKTKA